MEELLTFASLSALLTLAALEIVLGIDNLVFISILSGKLPPEQQATARRVGLALAAIGRILLLFGIAWLVTLEETKPFAGLFGEEVHAAAPADAEHAAAPPPAANPEAVDEAEAREDGHGDESFTQTLANLSVKDLILILGGIFLVAKATWEIHHSTSTDHDEPGTAGKAVASFGGVITQIFMLDLVFSIDSVLTAVGMVNPDEYQSDPFPGTDIPWPPLVIMVSAILLAIGVMLAFAGPVASFIQRHPSIKMLALSFLVMIGVVLVAEGFHQHIPRGYIYSAMGFSLFVDLLQMRQGRKLNRPGDELAHH